MIFWVNFWAIGVRWGCRRCPISGPAEIKDFYRRPMVHLQKPHSVSEAQLRRPKTHKEKDALDQNEFHKIMTKGDNFFLSSLCKYFD
jgi:hypothetical protein